MIYLPSKRYQPRFSLFEWVLPPNMLSWLIKQRGMGIYILPPGEAAQEILKKRAFINKFELTYDKRLAYQTAHYRISERKIIIPHRDFAHQSWLDTILHELGHAVDHLLPDKHESLSQVEEVIESLHPEKPFSEYCERKDKKNGYPAEQFATGFAGYFRQPEPGYKGITIKDLSPKFIQIMNQIIKLFEKNNA